MPHWTCSVPGQRTSAPQKPCSSAPIRGEKRPRNNENPLPNNETPLLNNENPLLNTANPPPNTATSLLNTPKPPPNIATRPSNIDTPLPNTKKPPLNTPDPLPSRFSPPPPGKTCRGSGKTLPGGKSRWRPDAPPGSRNDQKMRRAATTPKGLQHLAQGCAAGATLGAGGHRMVQP